MIAKKVITVMMQPLLMIVVARHQSNDEVFVKFGNRPGRVFCRGENIILSTTCRLGGIIMVNRTFCQTVWNSAGLWLWLGRAFGIARSKKQSRHFFVKLSPFTKFRVHSTSYNVMSVCLLNPTAFHVFSNFGVSVFTLTKHTFSWGMTTAYIFMAQ